MTLILDSDRPRVPQEAEAALSVDRVSCQYGHRRLFSRRPALSPRVVDDVSLAVGVGETLALVGESGSGKSTLARAIAGLLPAVSGRIVFDGTDVTRAIERRPVALRRRIQIVFQNPDASLNHRHRIGTILERPLKLFFNMPRDRRRREVQSLLAAVQFPADYASRFPSEISGGERQRVAIARALAARPSLLLCDEVVSALDVSVQAAILDLLKSIQRQTHLSVLFITHDLAVVRWFADRVAVLYRGQLCETAPVEQLFNLPLHPYTSVLLDAIPQVGRRASVAAPVPSIAGITPRPPASQPGPPQPGPLQPGAGGCIFAGQCRHAVAGLCHETAPPWHDVGKGHAVRCHLGPEELARFSLSIRPS